MRIFGVPDHPVRRQPAGCRRPPLLYQEGIVSKPMERHTGLILWILED
jgi:hypothetical protein